MHNEYRMTVRMSVVPNSAPIVSNPSSTNTLQTNTSGSNLNASTFQSQSTSNSSNSQNNANAMLSEERVRQHQQHMQQQQFANLSVSALNSAMMSQFNPAATGSSPVASTVSLNSFLQSSPSSQSNISTLSSVINTSPSIKKLDLPSQASQNAGNNPTSSFTLNSSSSSSALPNANSSVDQQNQSQAIVYDDINIFMWSVCQICNKVNESEKPHSQ